MSQFIEMFKNESLQVPLEKIVEVKDDCRKPINEGERSEMKEGDLYPYYGATGIVDYINDYITDEELLCIAEDCGNYKAGEESAYIIRGKAWVNNHAHLVKVKDNCDIKYLYYYLKITNLMPYVSGTTRLKLTQKKLKEILVTLPSAELQNRFVAIAEQADKSKFVGFKSQFIEMFENHNYMSVPLAELIDKSFPGEWGTEDENGNGTKVIRTTNITNSDKLDLSDVVTRNIVAAKLQKKQLCRGDILLERSGGTKDNPVGRVAYFDEDGVFVTNNFTQTLRCNNNIESRYLFYFLYYFYNLNKMKIRSMGNQTTGIQNLNMDDYMQISVIVPPRDLQKQFISIVTQADKSKYLN